MTERTDKTLALCGAGIVTDGYASIHELARSLAPAPRHPAWSRAQVLDPAAVAAHEFLPQLAIRALHQAVTMAGAIEMERLGLVVVTAWGMIDATVAYLDSMLDAGGKFASPRHFTRSVYSTAASLLAMHFHIHGPCETLAFDPREDPITGALAHAWRLVAAQRCHHVAVVWAEQASPLALDLARRASEQLHRREYDRYVNHELGYGAIALILATGGHPQAVMDFAPDHPFSTPPRPELRGNPFAMDAAAGLLASLLLPQ